MPQLRSIPTNPAIGFLLAFMLASTVIAQAPPAKPLEEKPATTQTHGEPPTKENASDSTKHGNATPAKNDTQSKQSSQEETRDTASTAHSSSGKANEDSAAESGPVAEVAANTETTESASALPAELADLLETARAKNHPLLPALEYAVEAVENIRKNIKDYTCTLVKRERVDGKLTDYQFMEVKIRHEQRDGDKVVTPFSVYLKFLAPSRFKGREVIYVEGKYNNDLVAKRGGRRNPNLTLRLDPLGPLAMDGNRYPIKEIGFYNLARRLIEVMKEELQYGDSVVEIFDNAKLNGRLCKRFKVTHPEKKDGLRFHVAEVLVDQELNIPVYYAAYTWPSKEGEKPRLIEQYFYTNVKVNVGLTDKDFDIKNEAYGFRDIDTVPVAEEENADSASESDKETDHESDPNPDNGSGGQQSDAGSSDDGSDNSNG